jgi:hypothetical protein
MARNIAKVIEKSRSFKPSNEVEQKLYAFYVEWMTWFDEYYKTRDKKFGKTDISREDSISFEKKYQEQNPKPKAPNLILMDFAYRDLADNLLARLQDGYYRLPKVIGVKSEYGTTFYLVNKHEDMGKIALQIFQDIEEGLIWIEDPEEPEPAWTLPKEELAKIPKYAREQIERMQEESKEDFERNTKYYKGMKRLVGRLEKAKKGDEIAAADILEEIYHHSDTDGNDLKITIQVPMNLQKND